MEHVMNPVIDLRKLEAPVTLGDDGDRYYDIGHGRVYYEGIPRLTERTKSYPIKVVHGEHTIELAANISLKQPVFEIEHDAILHVMPPYSKKSTTPYTACISNVNGDIQSGDGQLLFYSQYGPWYHHCGPQTRISILVKPESLTALPQLGEYDYKIAVLYANSIYTVKWVHPFDDIILSKNDYWLRRYESYTENKDNICLVSTERSAWALYDYFTRTLEVFGYLRLNSIQTYDDFCDSCYTEEIIIDESSGILFGTVKSKAAVFTGSKSAHSKAVMTVSGAANLSKRNLSLTELSMEEDSVLTVNKRLDLRNVTNFTNIHPSAQIFVYGFLFLPETAKPILQTSTIQIKENGAVIIGNRYIKPPAAYDFTAPDIPCMGDSYQWNPEEKILTLTNFQYSGNITCFRFPPDTTIVLKNVNMISVKDASVWDLVKRGTLTIKGSGELLVHGKVNMKNHHLCIESGTVSMEGYYTCNHRKMWIGHLFDLIVCGGSFCFTGDIFLRDIKLKKGDINIKGSFWLAGGLKMTGGRFKHVSQSSSLMRSQMKRKPKLAQNCYEKNGCYAESYGGAFVFVRKNYKKEDIKAALARTVTITTKKK